MMNPSSLEIELHELFNGRLKIFQKKKGYRFSIDTVLLGIFAAARASGTVVDLGTGSGVLPLVLAKHKKFDKIVGIEIQEELAVLARENISYHTCDDRVTVIHADIRTISGKLAPETFDAVVTNPPFYAAASGRINPNTQKAGARHEIHGTLRDFISCAAFLLKQSGKFIAVYRPARFSDLILMMKEKNIEPKTVQFVHARIDEPASMVLVEGLKGGGAEMKILPPLILYKAEGGYTEQAIKMLDAMQV